MSKASNQAIAEAIYLLIEAGKSEAELVKAVSEYLTAARRTKNLEMVMRIVERIRLQRDGTIEIVASSAFELSDSTKQAIAEIFGARHTKIIERKDDSLVGGVRLQAPDQMLDLSVRGRLNRLKNLTT